MGGLECRRARSRLLLGLCASLVATACAPVDERPEARGDDAGADATLKVLVSNGVGGTMSTAAYDSVSSACRAEPLVASRVYYVCDCGSGADPSCVAGADTNAGTQTAPFRTFTKALSTFKSMNAGEAVVLCRGGSFSIPSGQNVWNLNCRAGTPCTLRDYTPSWASGDEKDPLVTLTGTSAGLQFYDPGYANHDEGYVLRNLDIAGSGGSMGLRFYNDVDDVDMCNLTIHGFAEGIELGLTNASDTTGAGGPAGDGKNQRIRLRGSYLHHNTRQGFTGAGDGLVIDASYFDYNGTDASSSLHSIFLDANGDDIRVTRNTVRHSTQPTTGGACAGTAILMRRVHTGVLFESNDVRFDVGGAAADCGGLHVLASTRGVAESFTAVTIRGNRIVNAGQTSIGVSSCIDCVIEDNLVMQSQTTFDGTAILAPARTRSSADALDARLVVRSNTVVLAPGSRAFTGIGVTTEGTGHVVKSNVVYRTTAGTLRCFTYSGLAASAYDADYNLCFSTAATPIWNGATGASLATFQSTGEDLHSLVADPLFAPGAADVFVAGAGSPLRSMTNSASVASNDIDGTARGTTPDVGAFQSYDVLPPLDGGLDASTTDASTSDAGSDASTSDAGRDASTSDASLDGGDGGIDASNDGSIDARSDAGIDSGADAGSDGSVPPVATTPYEQVSAACRTAPIVATRVYYVCDCVAGADSGCVPGVDTNPGTAAAPFRTLAKAVSKFNAMAAGEAVALCRGGRFSSSTVQTLVNYACRAGTPCTMRDYTPPWASGDEREPALVLSASDAGLQFADGGLANHDEGYVLQNLELIGSGGSMGVFLYNDVDDVDMCNLTVRGFQLGVYLAGSNANDTAGADGPVGDGKNQRVRLRGSYIHHNSVQGWLGAGDAASIDANYFDYDGTSATTLQHSIYIDGPSASMSVTRNTVRHSTMTTTGGLCMGATIVVHGVQTDTRIEGNDVRFDVGAASEGCWGITVDAASSDAESFTRAIIRGNRVINAGSVAIGVSSCIDCVVEDNLVVQSATTFVGFAILGPDRTRASNDAITQRLTIRSNTLVLTPGSPSWTGIGVVREGTGHVVKNNVVVRTSPGAFACFDYTGLAASSYDADTNLCYVAGSASPVWNAATGATLATFQATGDDLHSSVADPRFAAGAPDTYFAGPGSPLRGTADPASVSPVDIDGVLRGSMPDLGAFQVH